jgi:hypothetical protein
MNKIKINQLKINTDTPDHLTINKNVGGGSGTSDMIGHPSVKIGKFVTNNNYNELGSFSPTQKNFSLVQSTKSNKLTEFSKRNSNNISGTNDNRRSFVENKIEHKSNTDKNLPSTKIYGSFIGTLSPKISNGIASKNSINFIFILIYKFS